jgi:hypothetical protein
MQVVNRKEMNKILPFPCEKQRLEAAQLIIFTGCQLTIDD